MKYIALFDGKEIARASSRMDAWKAGQAWLDAEYGHLSREERTKTNEGKIFRVVSA